MSLMLVTLIYLLTGAVAGFLAGLFGIGGGVIVVPALTMLFPAMGFTPEQTFRFAVGTSMLFVALTAPASAWNHNKKGNVDWARFRSLILPVTLGSIVGSMIGATLPHHLLAMIVVAFEWGIAIYFLMQWQNGGGSVAADTPAPPKPLSLRAKAAFFPLGALSSVVGISGGVLMVPVFNYLGGGMHRATGTAAALGISIGTCAAISYLIAAPPAGTPPEFSVGLVFIPAALCTAAASVVATRFGTALNKRLSERKLKLAFAILLFVLGFKILTGVL
jgi:uncharacterized protein